MPAYAELSMYCFSGTGNALAAGRWIATRAAAAGTPARLTRIDRLAGPEVPKADRALPGARSAAGGPHPAAGARRHAERRQPCRSGSRT